MRNSYSTTMTICHYGAIDTDNSVFPDKHFLVGCIDNFCSLSDKRIFLHLQCFRGCNIYRKFYFRIRTCRTNILSVREEFEDFLEY